MGKWEQRIRLIGAQHTEPVSKLAVVLPSTEDTPRSTSMNACVDCYPQITDIRSQRLTGPYHLSRRQSIAASMRAHTELRAT